MKLRAHIHVLFSLAILLQTFDVVAANPGREIVPVAGCRYQRAWRQLGVFKAASEEEHDDLAENHGAHKRGVAPKLTDEQMRPADPEDLALDLSRIEADGQRLQSLRQRGEAGLSRLYYFTSGAGLWSRGGGQVKALIPLNLSELLPASQIETLDRLSGIINESSDEKRLEKAGRSVPADPQAMKVASEALVREAKAQIDQILDETRKGENAYRALNHLDLKFVSVALASQTGRTYIPFDVWTSEQTHDAIGEYITWLQQNYERKRFHDDDDIDRRIKAALREYFATSERLGESHLFGVQFGFHALHPETSAPVMSSPVIGIGAGMVFDYLEGTGRAAALRDWNQTGFAKTQMLFENIEIHNELPTILGAHLEADRAVTNVVVRQAPGYSGGGAYIVQREDRAAWESHEDDFLPPLQAAAAKRAKQGELGPDETRFFNTNTFVIDLNRIERPRGQALRPPEGWENKPYNGVATHRAKLALGSITHRNPTAGVAGRIGNEYENLKKYGEYGVNGLKVIVAQREHWREQIQRGSGDTLPLMPPSPR